MAIEHILVDEEFEPMYGALKSAVSEHSAIQDMALRGEFPIDKEKRNQLFKKQEEFGETGEELVRKIASYLSGKVPDADREPLFYLVGGKLDESFPKAKEEVREAPIAGVDFNNRYLTEPNKLERTQFDRAAATIAFGPHPEENYSALLFQRIFLAAVEKIIHKPENKPMYKKA